MRKFYFLGGTMLFVFINSFSQPGHLDLSFGDRGKVNTNILDVNKGNEIVKALAIQPDGKIVMAGNTFSPSVILRFNPDGSPDNTFGNGQVFCFGFNVVAMALQSDGKIVVAGSDFSLARFNTDGTPDNSFGNNGRTSITIGSSYSSCFSVAVQSNGKIVLAGSSYNGAHDDFALARFNADGSADNSFDGDGKLVMAFSSLYNQARCVAIQPDNKIVVAGYNDRDFAVARYNVDGTSDNSFDGDGKLTTSFGSLGATATSIALQNDGKIVVAGYNDHDFAVARYNIDGTADNSFDGDGKQTTIIGASAGYPVSMALQTDGKILLAASNYIDVAAVRYNTNGSIDNSFDGDGIVITDINGNYDESTSIALQSNGKIIIGGYGNNTTGGKDFLLIRYNSDGSLDNSFDGDGKLTRYFATSFDIARSIAIQSDGKILVTGYTGTTDMGSNNDFVLTRYNSNGSIDNSFHGNGKVITDIGTADDKATSVALQADGKIVAGGYSAMNGTEYDFSLARYNSDGSPDNSFDGDGKLTTAFVSNSIDIATCMTVQNDGKIILAGYTGRNGDYDFALARYAINGSLDNSFNGNGKIITSLGSAADKIDCIAIQPDGKIIVGGVSGGSFTLVRYNANGSLDNSFDSDGKVISTIAGEISSLSIQTDGKIVAVGTSGGIFIVVRYNADGSSDNSFDGDGKVTTDMGGVLQAAVSVAIQDNGRIIVAGENRKSNSGDGDFILARYNGDGSLDNSFDGDGKVTLDLWPSSFEHLHDMKLYENRIYLAGEMMTAGAVDFVVAAVISDPLLGPLPLQLRDFTGKKVNEDALLTWRTEHELNMLNYTVERSIDGRNYTALGVVGAVNGESVHNYDFTDYNITSLNVTVVYYRLKQKSVDGRYGYSPIIVISLDSNKSIVLSYPNPVVDEVNVALTVYRKEKLMVRITDNNGRIVKQQQWEVPAGSTSLSIDVRNLAAGMYYLEINGEAIDYRKKFIK